MASSLASIEKSLKGCEENKRGCKPPLDRAQTIGVLKARKTIFRPFRASLCGVLITWGYTPVCGLFAPLGLSVIRFKYVAQNDEFGARCIFRTKCDFLQVLDLLIFRQIFEMQLRLHSKKGPIHGDGLSRKKTMYWGRGCLHFHLNYENPTLMPCKSL